MKGKLILCSLTVGLLCALPLPGQERERIDTLTASIVVADEVPKAVNTGLDHIDNEFLKNVPAVFGTPDVIKVLQNLPGVAAGMEMVSGLYVHGGDGSDNLFLLDGVPLYQISHLGGMFSSFNTDVVRSLDFYKSGFPARYGDRLSSVVDISTYDGDRERIGGSFTIGLIDARLRVNGPIVKDKLFFDVAVRRTWLDAILGPAFAISNHSTSPGEAKSSGSYSFLDGNASLTYLPGSNDKLSLRFFGGTDWFNYKAVTEETFYGKEIYKGESSEKVKMNWGNVAVSADWKHSFSDASALNLLGYYSRGYSNIAFDVVELDFYDDVLNTYKLGEKTVGAVNTVGLKSGWSYDAQHHRVLCGIDYQHSWFNPYRRQFISGEGISSDDKEAGFYRSDEVSAYAEDRMTYGNFNMNIGLRLDGYFSGKKAWFYPRPRLAVSYAFAPFLSVKASYSSMVQYSHLLSSIFMDLPTNLWMPSTAKIKPSTSRQVALGLYSSFAKYWHIDVEGYYKTMDNCIIYSGQTSVMPPLTDWDKEFKSGEGLAYGAEFDLGCDYEKVSASVYYTLSWSKRRFKDLYPDWFYDRFDNRHKLTLMATYRINRNIDISATWNYHSGNRVTMPEQVYEDEMGGTSLLFSSPYNAKLPDYHRLDIGANFRKKTRRGNESIWNVSIYNVYCRMNPLMMTFEHQEDGSLRGTIYAIFPIIPSFSYTIKF